MDVAQITLMGDDLMALPDAVVLSRKTVGMIWQNLFWAFVYNIVCIPLAAGALHIFGIDFQITPMWLRWACPRFRPSLDVTAGRG